VHFAPHGTIDVQAFGCDYLVCSGYKVFAPHMGFAWCRREAIDRLPTFREDFIPDAMPDKLEAGTYVYENVAGMDAAVLYLERLGRRMGAESGSLVDAIRAAMAAIRSYEQTLSAALLDAVGSIDDAVVHGIDEAARLDGRVPTVLFTVDGVDPAAIATELAARDVGVRSGHMYAPRLMRRLGQMPDGAVRVSLVHYNTVEEVARFRDVLADAVGALRSGKLSAEA
jgi:selenocysteine lyase/cysteine desulfurase